MPRPSADPIGCRRALGPVPYLVMPASRPHPRLPVRRSRGVLIRVIGMLLAAGLLLGACDNDSDVTSITTAREGAPSEVAPDTDLALPDGVDPIPFASAAVSLSAAGGSSHTIRVWIADNFDRRTRGLMFRTRLPTDTGMIFAFPIETTTPFWNQDTPLDIDIAFLAEDGTILEIHQLQRFSPDLITPTKEYRFALELPAGWFAGRAVGVGDRVNIPEAVLDAAE